MFSGIIEEVGSIIATDTPPASPPTTGRHFSIQCNFAKTLSQTDIGASIAINGVCQTIIAIPTTPKKCFQVFASKQTLALTNLQNLKTGDRVNLERSLKLNSRLDGHLVYGHVDFTAPLIEYKKDKETHLLTFSLQDENQNTYPETRYLVKKGSIALNGISLTVYQKTQTTFTVMVIPHTWEKTNLHALRLHDAANLEFDIFAKYLENFSTLPQKKT